MLDAHVIGNNLYVCKEKWKPVIFDGIKTDYEVSNLGSVRNIKTNKYIKGYMYKKYQMVTLRCPEVSETPLHMKISRLVAIAFIPIPKRYKKKGLTYKDLQVDHIRDGDNDNHEDNSIFNLQWLTPEENYRKAYIKGLMRGRIHNKVPKQICGENNYLAIHTNEDAIRVRDLILENKLSIAEIAKEAGVDHTFVKSILFGKGWKSVIGDCDFSGYTKSRVNKEINVVIDKWLCAGKSYLEIKNMLMEKGYAPRKAHSLIGNRRRALKKLGKIK